MITSHKIHNKDGSYYIEYKGLSGDPKPVNVKEGDVFLELNTDSVFKFTSGKWTRIPENGKSSGGDYPEIDIIGTDKKLADLSAVALGFDLPDEPDEPDVVATSTIDYEDPSWTKISDNMPFDINGLDVTDEDLYLNERGVILKNPMVISASLSPMTFKFIVASFKTYSTKTGHTCILDLYAPAGSDDAFTMSYFPFGDEENDIDPGLYWGEMPQGIPEGTVITITQEGKKGRKNIGNEISSKYLESPVIDGTTEKLNAVKSVGVGYTTEGETVTVENDGTGELIDYPMMTGMKLRKVAEESQFDYSGEEYESATLLTNPVHVSADANHPEYESIDILVVRHAGGPEDLFVGGDENTGLMYFVDAKQDISEGGMTLDKGLYVLELEDGEDYITVTSLTQKASDTVVKIDPKFIASPEVDGFDKDLLSAKKVGVGIDDRAEFVYSGDIEDYENVQAEGSDTYYIKIFDDPSMLDISGEGPTDGSGVFVFNKPITAIVGNGDDVHIPVGAYALFDYSEILGAKAFVITGSTSTTFMLNMVVAYENISEAELTLTKGVWVRISLSQENPMIADSISQGEIIKIPEKYLPSTGADAIFAIGAGRVGFQVSIVSADYDRLYEKLITDGKPLNVMVYLTGAGGQSYRALNVTRTEYSEFTSDIVFFVDDFTGYAMHTYPMDFPGVITLSDDNTAQWTVDSTAENFEIGFSASAVGGHQLLVSSGSYARLYELLSNGVMPNVKAYDMLYIEQQN